MKIRIRQGYNDLELVVDDIEIAADIIVSIASHCEKTTSFTFVNEEEEEE